MHRARTSTARCWRSAPSGPAAQRLAGNLDFVEANAEELPFADTSFDAYTIAFGIRNVPHVDMALAEALRVLRRGGRFLCLEFSEVDMPMLDKAYEAYSFTPFRRFGKLVAGDGEPYRYLVESIRNSRASAISPR